MRQKPFEETVTPEKLAVYKKAVSDIYEWIRDNFDTPEGKRWSETLERVMAPSKESEPAARKPLTKNEEKAFEFIRNKLSIKEQPSVREIASTMGLKSSRSGARLVNSLVSKGYIWRKGDANLVVI